MTTAAAPIAASADVIARAREFCATHLKEIAGKLDNENRFPTELLPLLAEEGFWGLNYPTEYGGAGLDAVTTHKVAKEFAKVSAGVALTFHVQWMATDVLLKYGTEEQKRKYLPDLIQGKKIAAFDISEVQAGSDMAGIKAEATRTEGGWLLNGAKYFCTNGGLADIYLVAFKTDPAAGAKGVSMFLIEKGTPGFSIGANEEKMGCRSAVLTALSFRDCAVGAEALVGKVNEGFKAAMHGLVGGRLGMASMGLGIAEAALEEAGRYANKRIAFGKPLSALYSVQEMLADMHIKLQAAELLVFQTAAARDSGRDYSLESSVAKLFVAETVTLCCHNAMQIFGGHGYMKAHAIERLARDGRLMDVGVGSSEVLKMVVGMSVAKSMATSS
jgi:alkylation response protein AidB-like acyl-CoA dehydrogenase